MQFIEKCPFWLILENILEDRPSVNPTFGLDQTSITEIRIDSTVTTGQLDSQLQEDGLMDVGPTQVPHDEDEARHLDVENLPQLGTLGPEFRYTPAAWLPIWLLFQNDGFTVTNEDSLDNLKCYNRVQGYIHFAGFPGWDCCV